MDLYKLKRGLKDPLYGVNFIIKKLARFISNDKLYLSLRWFTINHKLINWDNPKTFTEKLQWIKVNYRKPEFTTMVDKIEAKKYVASIIGEKYIIPTIAEWDSSDDIDFDSLPNKFVLKCNHDSGTGMCICKDKSKLNYDKVRSGLRNGLKTDYYIISREWPYKDVKRKVFAEQYMEEQEGKDLIDYKWFCFNGIPKYCQVIQDRNSQETIDFFDDKWVHQDFIGLNPIATNATNEPVKPKNLSLMLDIAQKLSSGLPFARIDLYEIKGKVYFGEITFFPLSGMGKFNPDNIDFEFGKLVKLPELEVCQN